MLKEEVDEKTLPASSPSGRNSSFKDAGGRCQKLVTMEERFGQRVVARIGAGACGQCHTASRAGLSDPKRPIGSFIFSRTTGVGKLSWRAPWLNS